MSKLNVGFCLLKNKGNNMLEILKKKYPTAISWSFGDNAQLADELAMLVVEGKKNGNV